MKRVTMKTLKYAISTCFILSILLVATVNAQRGPKNVQVLTDFSSREIRTYMKSVSKGIGEKCVYCHNLKDYSSDEKHPKIIGREFIKLVEQINKQVAEIKTKVLEKETVQPVTCYTCHAGELTIISEK